MRNGAGLWLNIATWRKEWESFTSAILRPLSLLHWFAVLGFLAVTAISIGFGAILSHFLVEEVLWRDALQTSQFVDSIVAVHNQEAQLGKKLTLGQIFDERTNLAQLGFDPIKAASLRSQFYDHIRMLPDLLLANVYSLDRKIIWSNNPALIGKFDEGNDELEEAYFTRAMVSTNYLNQEHHKEDKHKGEQAFVTDPKKFFVESYLPMLNGDGEVVAVVEIYKEPASLFDAIKRCRQLVWASTALGAILLYFALYGIARRAALTLAEQQLRLLGSETFCLVGEMSASMAARVRTPLMAIRSTAELALDGDLESVRKGSRDIIDQVDRLANWVRDLLVFSRPVHEGSETLDVVSLIDACLANFSAQLKQYRIAWRFVRPTGAVPRVRGNYALAAEALACVISNAIEAMPNGGSLQLELLVAGRKSQLSVNVTDSRSGLSLTQMDLAFKHFFESKRNGLGLGMALVRRIMERFGGAVRLSSAADSGSHVSLIFKTD